MLVSIKTQIRAGGCVEEFLAVPPEKMHGQERDLPAPTNGKETLKSQVCH